MAEKFTIKHEKDFETNGRWQLVRRSLHLKSFGINMVHIDPGDSIKEHDERDRDQEEVFVILEGHATTLIDGKEYDTPKGTFIRLDPEPKRNILNKSDKPITVLILSAPTTSGYEPMSWA